MRSVVDRNVDMGRVAVVLIGISLKPSEDVACVGGGVDWLPFFVRKVPGSIADDAVCFGRFFFVTSRLFFHERKNASCVWTTFVRLSPSTNE